MQPSPPAAAAAEARRPLSRLLMTTTTTLAALLLLLVPGAVAFRPPAAAATAAAASERRARLSSAPFGPEQQLPLADASQQRLPPSPLSSTWRTRLYSSSSEPEPTAAQPPQGDEEGEGEEEEEYGAIARLREEAESPFRPLRFFIYGSMAASGAIGSLITFTGALAALSGVRGATPLAESGQNLAIDVGAVVVASVLWKLDERSKNSRLTRLTMGAKIAQLKVQLQSSENGERPVRALADFRRGRGEAKRVVVVAGNQEVVQAALDAAAPYRQRLVDAAFLFVPVVLSPPGQSEVLGLAQERLTGALGEPYVGWPLLLKEWQEYLATEAAAARKQGLDPAAQGFSIVLKLNGRVGQRAVGVPNWDRLAGDVERRRSRGLDVINI